MLFDKYIGIDYSGAGDPHSPTRGIAIAAAEGEKPPELLYRKKWSRASVYEFLKSEFKQTDKRVIVGIDHGFSYPAALLKQTKSWDDFLVWFSKTWKTTRYTVEQCKQRNLSINSTEKRWVEEAFTPNAKSVVDLARATGRQGAVSYSTHAGLGWVYRLRRLARAKLIPVHFWPFDGMEISDNCHVICEAYPAIYKKRTRVQIAGGNEHEQDAYAIAAWIQERERDNSLVPYLSLPTLTRAELELAKLEGWILGCL